MRYKKQGPWHDTVMTGRYLVQVADCVDTRTNTVYREGAYRVVVDDTGKPAVRGKGGTHPFFGETAWMDAERLALDLATADRYGNSRII